MTDVPFKLRPPGWLKFNQKTRGRKISWEEKSRSYTSLETKKRNKTKQKHVVNLRYRNNNFIYPKYSIHGNLSRDKAGETSRDENHVKLVMGQERECVSLIRAVVIILNESRAIARF